MPSEETKEAEAEASPEAPAPKLGIEARIRALTKKLLQSAHTKDFIVLASMTRTCWHLRMFSCDLDVVLANFAKVIGKEIMQAGQGQVMQKLHRRPNFY